MTRWARGVVACAVVLLGTACSGGPEVEGPSLSDDDAATCGALVDALPETLAGAERVEVSGDEERGAAWGDPAFVLTCGVAEPEGFDAFSQCQKVAGVGWFVPPEAEEDLGKGALLTSIEHEPRVSLYVPSQRRGGETATALSELAAPVGETLERTSECQ